MEVGGGVVEAREVGECPSVRRMFYRGWLGRIGATVCERLDLQSGPLLRMSKGGLGRCMVEMDDGGEEAVPQCPQAF